MNTNYKTISLIVLSIFMLAVAPCVNAIVPAATRTLSAASPGPDSIFDVTLNLSGFQIGGIVETIPDGFTFVRTTHPANRIYVSGQKVAFVVINDTALKYSVRAPALEQRGTFCGIWYDALNGTTGDIKRTEVSVRQIPTSSPTPSSTPGFEAVLAVTVLLLLYPLLLFMKKGRREMGDGRREMGDGRWEMGEKSKGGGNS